MTARTKPDAATLRDYFEERSAIRQYCGGQTQKAAEDGAAEDLRRYLARHEPEERP